MVFYSILEVKKSQSKCNLGGLPDFDFFGVDISGRWEGMWVMLEERRKKLSDRKWVQPG